MATRQKPANIVGKEIQKLRYQIELTQEQFATQCQLNGLDISRGTVSQIEAQIRCVSDSELFLLASVLGVPIESLYPPNFKKAKRQKRK
jgi:transcriptional regulator with XRE-family HTH domain